MKKKPEKSLNNYRQAVLYGIAKYLSYSCCSSWEKVEFYFWAWIFNN